MLPHKTTAANKRNNNIANIDYSLQLQAEAQQRTAMMLMMMTMTMPTTLVPATQTTNSIGMVNLSEYLLQSKVCKPIVQT